VTRVKERPGFQTADYNSQKQLLLFRQYRRLTKTRAGDLGVCLGPDFLEFRFRGFRFVRTLVLQAQTLRQPEKRPAVVRQSLQIFAINFLGLSVAAISHESRA